ncbi:MAG: hypothetical protein ACRD97_10420, partial [Nitrososphaeraceae archaeon]
AFLDVGKTITSLDNKCSLKDYTYNKNIKRKKKELEDKLSRIPDEDEDIKDEIRKGNTVTIIEDSLDY